MVAAPEASRLDAEEDRRTGRLPALREQQADHRDWVAKHPEAARRLDDLAGEIEGLDERLQRTRGVPERVVGLTRPALGLARRWRGSAISALISVYEPRRATVAYRAQRPLDSAGYLAGWTGVVSRPRRV